MFNQLWNAWLSPSSCVANQIGCLPEWHQLLLSLSTLVEIVCGCTQDPFIFVSTADWDKHLHMYFTLILNNIFGGKLFSDRWSSIQNMEHHVQNGTQKKTHNMAWVVCHHWGRRIEVYIVHQYHSFMAHNQWVFHQFTWQYNSKC